MDFKKIIFYILSFIVIFISCNRKSNTDKFTTGETVTDIDGNIYRTVQIGTQVWMAENLKVTKFKNGDPIVKIIDDSKWEQISEAGFCFYDNNKQLAKSYGNLYNWHVINDARGICPEGWHVPTKDDWQKLSDYLGGNEYSGDKMKETGIKFWNAPNKEATNESGFTALPGGGRDEFGKFIIDRYGAHWWSSSEDGTVDAVVRSIYYGYASLMEDSYHKNSGFSIRCLKN